MCELVRPEQGLIELWKSVMGEPPIEQQFAVWFAQHSFETIKNGIVKTGIKNLKMGGSMSQDHRVRFASKTMATTDKANAEHAATVRVGSATQQGIAQPSNPPNSLDTLAKGEPRRAYGRTGTRTEYGHRSDGHRLGNIRVLPTHAPSIHMCTMFHEMNQFVSRHERP